MDKVTAFKTLQTHSYMPGVIFFFQQWVVLKMLLMSSAEEIAQTVGEGSLAFVCDVWSVWRG